MKMTLGISPCPNDTFIFDALLHQKIDTEGIEFDVFFADVKALNQMALKGELDVTKLSFHAFTRCVTKYVLLDSGSALGKKCGPLLITKPDTVLCNSSKIAIPGKYTTANFLLNIAKPDYSNKKEIIFSKIEDEVLSGNFDAGLIIHENRFTYQQKGLKKVQDLGELWEKTTKLPIPLGGIVVKRSLPFEIKKTVERVLRNSIIYALKNRNSSLDFVKTHAQEMNSNIINSHIDLYVNNYSVSLTQNGRKAVMLLFDKAQIQQTESIFL